VDSSSVVAGTVMCVNSAVGYDDSADVARLGCRFRWPAEGWVVVAGGSVSVGSAGARTVVRARRAVRRRAGQVRHVRRAERARQQGVGQPKAQAFGLL